jgi:signal transduction histidine kinase
MSKPDFTPPVAVLHLGGPPGFSNGLQSLLSRCSRCGIRMEWAPSIGEIRAGLGPGHFAVVILGPETDPEVARRNLAGITGHSAAPPVLVLSDGTVPGMEPILREAGAADVLPVHLVSPELLERAIRLLILEHQRFTPPGDQEMRILINERLASVGLLASGMAHEIGTPLGVIRGRAEVLLMKRAGDESLKRDLGIIISQVDRISTLMKALLNLARGDDAKLTGAIDLGVVVSEVVGIMGATFRLHGISVVNELESDARIRAVGKQEPFHQILCNLFQNSIQAIDRARRQGKDGPHEVKVTLRGEGPYWRLSVSDTGCGILVEDQARLFRPFFSTKGICAGLGLGLALSHRIVQSWRGSITFESPAGQGASFHIHLPKEAQFSEAQ